MGVVEWFEPPSQEYFSTLNTKNHGTDQCGLKKI